MPTKKELEAIMREINTNLKTGFTFGNDPTKTLNRISTGEPLLDSILGGGIPRRGNTVIFGPPSCGKTFICQKIIAAVQSVGGTAALIDAEFSFDPDWYSLSGVNIDELFHVEPDNGEQALDAVLAFCKAGLDLIVVDSAAALVPEEEMEGSMEDMQIGLQARLLNKFFRKIGPINKSTAIVIINQTRAGIGQGSGRYVPQVLAAGKGQEYFTKVILEVKKGDEIYKDGESKKKRNIPLGFYMSVFAQKNKTHQPFLRCDLPFYFTGDTDELLQMFQVALSYGIITQGGAYYKFGDVQAQGRPKFLDMMRNDEGLFNEIVSKIKEV